LRFHLVPQLDRIRAAVTAEGEFQHERIAIQIEDELAVVTARSRDRPAAA
jgi:hypothetical protein